MDTRNLSPHMLVSEILDSVPGAASIFARRGMSCPGCAMAPFMTLSEAAVAHKLDANDLVAALKGGRRDARRISRKRRGEGI